jgi:hypothetical protein
MHVSSSSYTDRVCLLEIFSFFSGQTRGSVEKGGKDGRGGGGGVGGQGGSGAGGGERGGGAGRIHLKYGG